jgi:hypothetical protein
MSVEQNKIEISMKKKYFPLLMQLLLQLLFICNAALCTSEVSASTNELSFGVISVPSKENPVDTILQNTIDESDKDNLAFVVANGIKANNEPCNDSVYTKRKAMFDSAQNGLIVSLTAGDWSDCKNASGRSAAVERLNRVRELFFVDEFSFGASKIPLFRQSASPKFRSYGENARWEFNSIIFSTINLPGNNNHYLAAAGRNSEFDDRQLANQEWLQRIASYATHKKLHGIVLFCDGNPLSPPVDQNNKRDGFLEIRRQLNALAIKFPGKILLIHTQGNPDLTNLNTIKWNGNVGELGVVSGWVKLTASPSIPTLFSIVANPADVTKQSQ